MNFISGKWENDIDVRDFIQKNYTPYDGNSDFLSSPSKDTLKLWDEVKELLKEERNRGGMMGIDNETISTIDSHSPGYINKNLEKIVGLQTDAPLKRAIMPFGGKRMLEASLKAYNQNMVHDVKNVLKYRKTHNDGVFDAYTDEMKRVRHTGIITGLPDAYGRGRIIGDYRRVSLYGVDYLIKAKQDSLKNYVFDIMDEDVIRQREEISEQIRALKELKNMALSYGFDISMPAKNTLEAIQWLYFGYLAAIKEQNGAAMSIGRISTFLDIYAEKDLSEGNFTESEIQEFVDHFVMKLRLVRFLRTPSYDELFSGDPTWVTESLGGVGVDSRHMVTKMTYRFMHTLTNLGPAPEPNMTVLWSTRLPQNYKNYCSKLSIETSSIQYENDDLMREKFGDDYGIACCVSAMRIGKQLQFFGARANLAKALLYAINGGRDEITGDYVGKKFPAITSEYLDFDEVYERFDDILDWLSKLYINTLNIIHYMHDKYCYERIQMALHDEEIIRTSACGIAGLSVVVDSLSAIKYAKVKVLRNEKGLAYDYVVEGNYPTFGNNDDSVDKLAVEVVRKFMDKLSKNKTYRNSKPTMSILTITSNVVYGKKTGNTPDGRKYGEPFAPGANPMHNRDTKGCVASMASVAKLPYDYSEDGISYTFSIVPETLGRCDNDKIQNLSDMMDSYFADGGHHINVNVINKDVLLDAIEHPELYSQLTIRVSGYAVNFIKLTKEQQLDVINRTFHQRM